MRAIHELKTMSKLQLSALKNTPYPPLACEQYIFHCYFSFTYLITVCHLSVSQYAYCSFRLVRFTYLRCCFQFVLSLSLSLACDLSTWWICFGWVSIWLEDEKCLKKAKKAASRKRRQPTQGRRGPDKKFKGSSTSTDQQLFRGELARFLIFFLRSLSFCLIIFVVLCLFSRC